MGAGGLDRWKVIAVAAGGRHTLAMAVPNSGPGSEHDSEEAARQQGLQGLSLGSSRGASPLESEDPESQGDNYDDEVDLGGSGDSIASCKHVHRARFTSADLKAMSDCQIRSLSSGT